MGTILQKETKLQNDSHIMNPGGVYLYRHMGASAKETEKPYYERIGIFYTIPRFHHLRVGCSVKAHLTKADLTEIVISLPFRLFLSDK